MHGKAFETHGPHLLAMVPCFARDGKIHPRHARRETYQQTWQANPLHLCHLSEERFESNELYGL